MSGNLNGNNNDVFLKIFELDITYIQISKFFILCLVLGAIIGMVVFLKN